MASSSRFHSGTSNTTLESRHRTCDTKPDTARIVAIIDDDDACRSAIHRLIQSIKLNAMEYGSAMEFLESLPEKMPDALILDNRLPRMSGLALQEELTKQSIHIPIIFLSGFADVNVAVDAMRNGAFDFVTKPFEAQRLIESVQAALAQSDSDRRLFEKVQAEVDRISQLTSRQVEVLELMVAGHPNKVIAAELGVSQRTVEVHRAALMRKLGVESFAQAVRSYWIAQDALRM